MTTEIADEKIVVQWKKFWGKGEMERISLLQQAAKPDVAVDVTPHESRI